MESKLKKCWLEATFAPANGPEKRSTALQRLIARYKWFSAMALFFTFAFPFMTLGAFINSGVTGTRLYSFFVFVAAYFLLCSAMDRWLARALKEIDLATMSVSEVCSRAFHCRRMHLRFILILLPLAFILLGWMAYLVHAELPIVYGMIAGGIAGLIIGILQLRRFLKDYRALLD